MVEVVGLVGAGDPRKNLNEHFNINVLCEMWSILMFLAALETI